MKKNKFISLLLVFTLLFSFSTMVYGKTSEEIDELILLNEFTETTTARNYVSWDYPVEVDPVEWGDNSKEELVTLLQIPNDILIKMPTSELVKLVLRYPFLSDMLYYPNGLEGLEKVANEFNGLRELLTRADAPPYLMEAYKASKNIYIDAETANKNMDRFEENKNIETLELEVMDIYFEEDLRDVFTIKCITLMLLSPQAENSLNSYAKTKSLTAVDYKDFFIREFEKDDDLSPLEYMLEDKEEALKKSTRSSTGYVYTPTGVSVSAIALNKSMTNAELNNHANSVRNTYGGEVLSRATWDYNCHTYAWYSQSTYSTWWINNPKLFYSGSRPSYDRYNGLRRNDKVLWGSTSNPEHSGIVAVAGTSKSSTYIESKWGEGCLVYHRADRSPYVLTFDLYGYR